MGNRFLRVPCWKIVQTVQYKHKNKHAVGKVIGVSGNTFTSENGHFIYIFDKKGKKINTKAK